jgi:hypothetical protein
MEDGAEDLVEQTRMVVRRADRVSRRSKWKTPKAEFQCWIAMEHVPTGKYLSILPSITVPSLEEQFQSDASIFGVYARGGGSGGGQQRQQQYHGDDKAIQINIINTVNAILLLDLRINVQISG